MKEKLYNLLLVLFIIGILWYQKSVTIEIRKAITLFQNNVFPSLFPFLVLSPFFISYGLADTIKKYLGPILKKIFHISENASYLFFMSMISGFPSSATNAKNLYEEKRITQKEAFHTLLFSHFSNPIFILAMVPTKPMIVLFSHYISNIIIGILLRFRKIEETDNFSTKKKISFFELFSSSIKNAMQTSLFILGVIVFFFMINAVIDIPTAHLLLELSQGLSYATTLSLSPKSIACIQAFILSFGGFSVHIQTLGILSSWNISYFPYFLTRIVHGICASLIVLLLF